MEAIQRNVDQTCSEELANAQNGEDKLPASQTFMERSANMPVIAGALSYISSTYNSVKDKNEAVAPLIDGVERSVNRAASAAYTITNKVVSYEYLDNLACKGLDKMEGKESLKTKVPVPSEESTQGSGLSNLFWNNTVGKSVMDASNKALNATESVVERMLPPKEGESTTNECSDGNLTSRITFVAGTARKRIVTLITDASKPQVKELDSTTTVKETSTTINWLKNVYSNLQAKSENEAKTRTFLRYSAMTAVGATLTLLAVVEATFPGTEKKVWTKVSGFKETSIQALNHLQIVAKTAGSKVLETAVEKSEKAFIFGKALAFQLYLGAVNYAKNVYNKSNLAGEDLLQKGNLTKKDVVEQSIG